MSRQIGALKAHVAHQIGQLEDNTRTINIQNAQLTVTSLYSTRLQTQLANSEKRKSRSYTRVATNGHANYLTHESLVALGTEARSKADQKAALE